MPILKWRQGEYQALYRLADHVKGKIVPILVVPPVEYDFEERKMKKSVHDHIEPFPRRFCQKWGNRPALIDIHHSLQTSTMASGKLVVDYIFGELRAQQCRAGPVVGVDRSTAYTGSIKRIVATDGLGLGIRLSLEDVMTPSIDSFLSEIMNLCQLGRPSVDIIIDLGLPESFEPYSAFCKALIVALDHITGIDEFRSFVVAGTSLKLGEVKSPGDIVPRHEWLAYEELSRLLLDNSKRAPSFGDYAIEQPNFLDLDMRFIKPAGKIVYNAGDKWLVQKGKVFRGNERQMVKHCQSIVESGYYMGADYSAGDRRILETANGTSNTGNLSTWKQVGISHHLTTVVDQLASHHAS